MGRRTILLVAALLVAALGTSLVFLYVSSVDARAKDGQTQVEVLVAKTAITLGTKASDAQAQGAFEKKTVAKDDAAQGAISDITPVLNLITLAPIFPGQQIQAAMFGEGDQAATNVLPLDKGDFAMSISMGDPNRVAGFLRPGSEVAIFVTYTPKSGTAGPTTQVLLPRVRVIATGNSTMISTTTTAADGASQTTQLPLALLTLAVNQQEFQKIVFAQGNGGGSLYFGLLNKDSKVDPGMPGTNSQNLFK